MVIFDIFRSGYDKGYQDGKSGNRHRAEWELLALKPVSWLPGVDADSYVQGYRQGFSDAIAARYFLAQVSKAAP